jgi:hypothetical protein
VILPEDITLSSSLCLLCILSSLCQYRAGAFNCRFRTKNAANGFACFHYLAIVQRNPVCGGYGVVCGIVLK